MKQIQSQPCIKCNKLPGRKKIWKRRILEGEEELYKSFTSKKITNSRVICNACNTSFWKYKKQVTEEEYKGVQKTTKQVSRVEQYILFCMYQHCSLAF